MTYQVQVDNDVYFRTPEVSEVVEETTYTTMVLPDGRYYWRVRAANTLDVYGAWSSAWYFTVDTTPPAAPVLSLPKDNGEVATARPTYRWSAATTATRYGLQVSRNPGFTDLVTNTTLATTTYTASAVLAQGTYYWHIQAQDAAGNWGAFSPTFSFKVNLLRAPADSSFTTDTTPLLQWYTSPGALRYHVQLADNPNFEQAVVNIETPNGTTASYTVPTVLAFGKYYWRVSVITGAGLQLTPFYRTLTITPMAPGVPVQVNPLYRAITNKPPTFEWKPLVYTFGAVSYELQVDNDSYFRTPEVVQAVNATTFALDNLLADGLYYWRVRAVNQWGFAGTWSAGRPFTIDTIAPAAPRLYVPAAAAVIKTARPAFSWYSVSGATGYRLQISTESTFANPLEFNATTARYTL
ncbi:MAG TPA: hypothetical protein VHO69_06810, partial [Phototrophicaceae bacterium]|nr:hypothetical protein [Phototrophicaceae bacterium]